jgi:hypothetical protein
MQECEIYDFTVDDASSGGLSTCLQQLHAQLVEDNQRGKYLFIMELLSKKMQLAKYFCAGAEDHVDGSLAHYALSVDLYTHFTSPIRRYPDVIVHRLLAASLGVGQSETRTPQELEDIAHVCNVRKYGAKRVSDLSTELFFALFIRENGPITMDVSVVGVLDKAADLLIHRTHTTHRIYFQQEMDFKPLFMKHASIPQLNEARLTRVAGATVTLVSRGSTVPKGSTTPGDLPAEYHLKLFAPLTVSVSVAPQATKLTLHLI